MVSLLELSRKIRRMIDTVDIKNGVRNLDIHEYAFLLSEEVIFSEEVRRLCEKNACGQYGTCWACPPAVGSLEACRNRCLECKNAFLFSTVNSLKNQYDMEGWEISRRKHEKVTDTVVGIFQKYDEAFLTLSTEGCLLCKKCTYPDSPCKLPSRMYPATEGFGIMVVQLAANCKIKYHNGANTVTYFSIIFFN